MTSDEKGVPVGIQIVDDVSSTKGKEMEFITPYDLHKRWSKSITLKTMANWRSLGLGPPYQKIRGRVLYRMEDILSWEAQQHFKTKQ